ncbi:MAG: hypothetical protein AAF968_16175 [Pseudomonadota bacterium]
MIGGIFAEKSVEFVLDASHWRAGVPNPNDPHLITAKRPGFWKPKEGSWWTNTETREERFLGIPN